MLQTTFKNKKKITVKKTNKQKYRKKKKRIPKKYIFLITNIKKTEEDEKENKPILLVYK